MRRLVVILLLMLPWIAMGSWHTPRVEPGVSPAGNDTNIQFNDTGALAGSDNLTWSNGLLFVNGQVTLGSNGSPGSIFIRSGVGSNETIALQGTDGSIEGGIIIVDEWMLITPTDTPPDSCSGASEGGIYSDTSHAICWCDGTTWTKIAGAGTCA